MTEFFRQRFWGDDGYACNTLLNSISDIPSLGPVFPSRAMPGLADFKMAYNEHLPHRAMVPLRNSALLVSRLAKATANCLLTCDAAGRPICRGTIIPHNEMDRVDYGPLS